MSDKKIFNSFQEFGEAYFKEHPEIETQKILHSYGVDIPLEEMDDIEILDTTKARVSYLNNKTNEIVTSFLNKRVWDKYDTQYSVCLTTSDYDGKFFVEHFHSIKPVYTYEEAGRNALAARKDPKARLLSRAYADIDTKYGNFCLHIESGYTDYKFGPYCQVSLYYGHHDEVIKPYDNDFDYNNFCLFRSRYVDMDQFNKWAFGYMDSIFCNPNHNMWRYGTTTHNGKIVFSPIYGYQALGPSNNAGVIIIDGNLKLEENSKCLPDLFISSLTEKPLLEYENGEWTSKAYFCNYGEFVAILKKGSTITIEYNDYNVYTTKWKTVFSETIDSVTDNSFTNDDFERVCDKLGDLDVSDRIKGTIVNQLTAYSNIHDADQFDTLTKFTLEPFSFDDMLGYIRQHNLTQLVENGLEAVSETFDIGMSELLGENAPNQKREVQYVKKADQQ